jgi:hypothetical protein
VTPFLLELACAFETSAGVAHDPWEFEPPTATMWLHGRVVEPCGWRGMEVLAVGDPAALRWLEVLRNDVEHRLRVRAERGSIYEPRP